MNLLLYRNSTAVNTAGLVRRIFRVTVSVARYNNGSSSSNLSSGLLHIVVTMLWYSGESHVFTGWRKSPMLLGTLLLSSIKAAQLLDFH